MLPNRVLNLGPLALESDTLLTVLHGPAKLYKKSQHTKIFITDHDSFCVLQYANNSQDDKTCLCTG